MFAVLLIVLIVAVLTAVSSSSSLVSYDASAARLLRRLNTLESSVVHGARGQAFDDYRVLQSNALRALLAGEVELATFRQSKVVNDAVPTEVHDVGNALLLDRIVRASPRYATRYAALAVDAMVGGPALRMPNDAKATPKSVQVAFMTALFESTIHGDISECDLIVEFGGGYGSLAAGVFALGFTGTYIIFDLPVASALQEHFLTQSGIPVAFGAEPRPQPATGAGGVGVGVARLVSTLGDLAAAIETHDSAHAAAAPTTHAATRMFLALWSFSESPVALRDAIAPLLANFDRFFIGYQPLFHDVVNRDYFDSFKRSLDAADVRAARRESSVLWSDGATPLVIEARGSRFLIGARVGANSLPYAATPPAKITAQSVDVACGDEVRAADDVARYVDGARDLLATHGVAAETLAQTLRSEATKLCAAPASPPSVLLTFMLTGPPLEEVSTEVDTKFIAAIL